MTEIILKGELGERFTDRLYYDVPNVQEAMWAVGQLYPGFKAYIIDRANHGVMFHVMVGDAWELSREAQLKSPTVGQKITVTPIISGSGKIGKFLPLLLGGALIGLGTAGIGLAFFSPATTLLIGETLAVNGLSGIFGKPKKPKEAEKKESLMMGGAFNTSRAGDCYQIVFGRKLKGVGSDVVSAGVRSSYEVIDDGDDDSIYV